MEKWLRPALTLYDRMLNVKEPHTREAVVDLPEAADPPGAANVASKCLYRILSLEAVTQKLIYQAEIRAHVQMSSWKFHDVV